MPNPDGSPAPGEEGYVPPAADQIMSTDFVVAKEPDGMLKVNDIRYVPETDLISHKTANDTRIAELTEAHKSEISKYMGGESTVRSLLIQTQAENETLKASAATAADIKANLDKVTAELEASKTSYNTASALALDFRKKFIVKEYGVEAAKLEGKDMNQLSFFEEALVAVNAGGGAGQYALGGNQGAGDKAKTKEERIQANLDAKGIK